MVRKERRIGKQKRPLATVDDGGVGVTMASAGLAPRDCAQAVVLMRLPRWAGRLGADCTGGNAASKAVAVELWISWAFFRTVKPTACRVPVSAIVVDS